METFRRFPHTPHLAWLGSAPLRDDKVLTADEARELLSHEVTLEEKVDGANLGLSLDDTGKLRAQSRGAYLELPGRGQWKPLAAWLAPRSEAFGRALEAGLILFGEWCYARHTVAYNRLPDWFLGFDVYERATQRFWSVERRDELLGLLGVAKVPRIARGHFDVAGVARHLARSALGDEAAEGLYVRRDAGQFLHSRAKLVRVAFVQAIDQHWSRRAVEPNRRSG